MSATFNYMGLEIDMSGKGKETNGFLTYISKSNPTNIRRRYFKVISNDKSCFSTIDLKERNFSYETLDKQFYLLLAKFESMLNDKDLMVLNFRFFHNVEKALSPILVTKFSDGRGDFEIKMDIIRPIHPYTADAKNQQKAQAPRPANTSKKSANPDEDNIGNIGKPLYKDLSPEQPPKPATGEQLQQLVDSVGNR